MFPSLFIYLPIYNKSNFITSDRFNRIWKWRDYGSETKILDIRIARTRVFLSFLLYFSDICTDISTRGNSFDRGGNAIFARMPPARRDRPPEDRARRCIAPTTSSRGNGIRSLACRGSEIQLVSCAEVTCGYREIRKVSLPPLPLPLPPSPLSKGIRSKKVKKDKIDKYIDYILTLYS